LYKNNSAITYVAGLSFYKPSDQFFAPLQVNIDPSENITGLPHIIPSKTAYISMEWLQAKKASVSHTITGSYSFDNINFFTTYDSVKKILRTFPNNGGVSLAAQYLINYQRLLSKKINLSVDAALSYTINKNNIYKTKNKGVNFSFSNTFTYLIGPKYGRIGFSCRSIGRQITTQGFYPGSFYYNLYYSKAVLKNKIVFILSAKQFLLKNRNIKTYTYDENIERYSLNMSPYRLLEFRVMFNFANIKVSKMAEKKTARINGEISN
jgi:hypothetical protein